MRKRGLFLTIIFLIIAITITSFLLVKLFLNKAAPSYPIKIDLSLSKVPNIGETTYLYATITSTRDIKNLEAAITIPFGIEIVNGNLEWKGDIVANEPIIFGAKIKVVEDGNWVINAECDGAVDSLYLSMKDGKGILYKDGFPRTGIGELSPCPPKCELIDKECICR